MRSCLVRSVIVLFLMFQAASSLDASYAAPVSLSSLASKADLVVVANVLGTLQQGWDTSVTLEVDRVLKGTAIPGSTVTLQYQISTTIPLDAINFPRVDDKWARGLHGLWFLKKTEGGGWTLLPTTAGPSIPFEDLFVPLPAGPLSADFSYSPSDDVMDKIARELGAALDKHVARGPAFLVLERLGKTNSPGVLWLYRRLIGSPEPALRVMGWAGILRLGDLSALAHIEQELPRLSEPVDFEPASLAIGDVLDADPSVVEALGRIATSTAASVSLRRNAAYALFSIHTKETLPFLAKLFDDVDKEVRREAMAGLASFANSGYLPERPLTRNGQPVARAESPYVTKETLEHFPSPSAFEQNEAEYLQFWKTWWTRMQPQIVP